MLPYLKRSEHTDGKDPNFRGTAGPMRIEEPPPPSLLMQALFQAAVDSGLPAVDDGNGCRGEGVFWHESNIVAGRRQSAADAYLRPALSRPNLTVVTDALVLRLVMDGSHCRGVEYAANGGAATITVERDVVLCAGVIGSPQILMLSGMGPAEHLQEHGVAVRMNLPGVGANLHDHPLNWISFDANDVQDSPAPSAGGAALTRTSSDVDPDLWLAFVPAAVKPLWQGGGPGLSILFSLVNPASRGTVRLRSADPDDEPLIDPVYLTEEADVQRMLVGLNLARAIARSEALASVARPGTPARGTRRHRGRSPRIPQADQRTVLPRRRHLPNGHRRPRGGRPAPARARCGRPARGRRISHADCHFSAHQRRSSRDRRARRRHDHLYRPPLTRPASC
jgi:choline dehydrogenase